MLRIEFTSLWPVIVFAMVLAVFLAVWTIRTIRNSYYPGSIKYILAVLRIVAIALFILLLTDLNLEVQRPKQVPPDVAFLWDLSLSMPLSDSSFSAKKIINSKEFRELERMATISHIHNMQDPESVTENRIKQLSTDEHISNNGTLLRFAESRAKYDELVLVSDGNSYLGESLENIRLAEGMNVHVIGVGSKKPVELPQLKSLDYPAMIFESDSLPLSWFLYNPSDDSVDCAIILRKDGNIMFREQVLLPAKRMIPMKKSFQENISGIHEWEFSIETGSEETVISRELINVHDSKVTVVFFADPPDQDVAMMVTVLRENEQYDVVGYDEWEKEFPGEVPDLTIQTWQPGAGSRLFPTAPAILICRDETGRYIGESDLRIAVQRPYVNFSADPSENDLFWTQLPPVQISSYPHKGKVVLNSINDRPVLLENREERAIIINAAGLWRWNLAGYDKDWNGIYPHMVNGMAKSLLWQFENSYIALDDIMYRGLEYDTFPIAIRRYDEENVEDAHVVLRILDSNKVEISRKPFENEQTTHYLNLDKKGEYFAVAELVSGDVLMQSDTARILIEKNDMEMRAPGCDQAALLALAEHHRGEYIHYHDLSDLPDMVSPEKKWVNASTLFIARNSYVLYALMFLLLVADWVIRKRNGGI